MPSALQNVYLGIKNMSLEFVWRNIPHCFLPVKLTFILEGCLGLCSSASPCLFCLFAPEHKY